MKKNVMRSLFILTIALTMALNLGLAQPLSAESTEKYADNELDISSTSNFDLVWSDLFSGAKYDCHIYKPIVPKGYYALGYYGQQNYDDPTGKVLVVKEKPNGKGALANPVDYKLVWSSKGVFTLMKAYFWEPVPPAGYTAMGMVVTNGKKPSVNEVVCVREDLTVPAAAGDLLWNDMGTDANTRFSAWTIQPKNIAGVKSISSGTFVGTATRTAPSVNPVMNCLKLFSVETKISKLSKSFDLDGYSVSRTIEKFGRVGMIAEHKTAVNYDTKEKKKVYYVEGSHYEMGYLMGMMSEKEISSMVNDFSREIVSSYIGSYLKAKDPDQSELITNILLEFVTRLAKNSYDKNIPWEIKDELKGVYEGCLEANPNTSVTMDKLIVLNTGIDVLCSLAYTGGYIFDLIPDLKPSDLNIPVWCNAMNVFGEAAGNGNYFGRDFMFNTGNTFHNVATLVIYNPIGDTASGSIPFISQTAPGIIGSITAININGVAAGVDMSPAMNCTPTDIGVNSLLMVRRAVEFGSSAEQAVNVVKTTKRGVSWDYIIADGINDRSCIIEAGASSTTPDFFKHVPSELKPYLPDAKFLAEHPSEEFQNGMMVRWNDYKYPDEYLDFNPDIWNYYNSSHTDKINMYSDAFLPKGYINNNYSENNCPSTYYFAPQREVRDDVLILTNHFVIPEMRLFAMSPWISTLLGKNTINDIQWRYDELNNQVLTALEQNSYISYDKAKELIDYLAPYGKYPSYYKNNKSSRDGKEKVIHGCVSLCDLKNKTIESHFGYYCDEWIKLDLQKYLNR